MKTIKALTIILAVPVILGGCDRREMPREWEPWEPVVSMDQKTAMAPKCYGWDYSIDKYIPPEGEVDFACATAGNLAHMVERPRDLVQGRHLSTSDAARSDLYVDKLREGKITPIIKDEKIIVTK